MTPVVVAATADGVALSAPPEVLVWVAAACQREAHRTGPPADATLVAIVAAIRRHCPPTSPVVVDTTNAGPDDRLMPYRTAADRLGVSPRTVSRLVAAGHLDRIGRRVTAASVERLARG